MKVFNLTTNAEVTFINVTPEWAVAYCYCEEHRMLSALFSRRETLYPTLPFTRGVRSIACGDWAVCISNT